jgi:hypothetical protein
MLMEEEMKRRQQGAFDSHARGEHINHYTINAAYAFKNVKLDH